ncbi:hypothetical protein [uncultured Nitrospira sp.]|uniref:hypothetical protein n=1 Tax=uncultured Nitrospira sp. TaxID=157176 RepID=UPI003140A3B5
MKKIRQQPTTRTWRLLSLTGLALSVAFFLNEGQARTLPMSPSTQSIKEQCTHPTQMASKNYPLEKDHASQSTKSTKHHDLGTRERDNDDKPQKKKFGLAILFLGTLAEKS